MSERNTSTSDSDRTHRSPTTSDPRLGGMLVHTTPAVAVDRVPLGIIKQQTWIRPGDQYGKKADRKKKPIE